MKKYIDYYRVWEQDKDGLRIEELHPSLPCHRSSEKIADRIEQCFSHYVSHAKLAGTIIKSELVDSIDSAELH